MEIKGTIIHAMPEVSGVSKAGNSWKKKEYVLEFSGRWYTDIRCWRCDVEQPGAAPAAAPAPGVAAPIPAAPAEDEFPF